MTTILQELKTEVRKALVQAFGDEFAEVDPLVVPATNPSFGDYQSNIALTLAKQLKQAPIAIAKQIVEQLNLADYCETPTIAGPGFINLTLKVSYLETQFTALYDRIEQDPVHVGIPLLAEDLRQTIVVDYSSPNIAKEMHVGHLRSTIIGDAIANVLEFRGHKVLRLNHVGDWGTQFGMLIAYLREAYPQALTTADALDLGDLVALYKKAKVRFDEDEAFKETAHQEVVNLQGGAEDSLRAWRLLCAQSRREFQVLYDRLWIKALNERGESFYNPFLADIIDLLDKKGLVQEDAGAKCVFLEGFTNKAGDPQPLIVQKSDGGYNYATTDLAALNYRINKDKADKIIYVTDAGQANHFAQVFQVARRAGILPDTVEVVHVPFGLVKGEDGKKLKTRSGDTIRLSELLDEAIIHAEADLRERETNFNDGFIHHIAEKIGIGAVKYADLSQNRSSDYIFSYDKMLSLQGNTATYLLYAYVRIHGIRREGADSLLEPLFLGRDRANRSGQSLVQFLEESEIALAKFLLQYGEIIQEVEQTLLPNRLCEYLYELSRYFNRFYENCPVLKADGWTRTSRVLLCSVTADILASGLQLLGIELLEEM
jgi:arginyl-tRNA synthetase